MIRLLPVCAASLLLVGCGGKTETPVAPKPAEVTPAAPAAPVAANAATSQKFELGKNV